MQTLTTYWCYKNFVIVRLQNNKEWVSFFLQREAPDSTKIKSIKVSSWHLCQENKMRFLNQTFLKKFLEKSEFEISSLKRGCCKSTFKYITC